MKKWVLALSYLIISITLLVSCNQNIQPNNDGASSVPQSIVKLDALEEDKTYTLTTTEEIKWLYTKGYIDEYTHIELLKFLGEQNSYFSDKLKISDFSINFNLAHFKEKYKFDFNFTVEESNIENLPKGSYEKEVYSGAFLGIYDKNPADNDIPKEFLENEDVQSLLGFIASIYAYNTPDYGTATSYDYVVNYIVDSYSDGKMLLTEFKDRAYEIFGIPLDTDDTSIQGHIFEEDNKSYIQSGGLGGNPAFDIVDCKYDNYYETSTIMIQFYADHSKFINSHKIKYTLQNSRFLACEIVEESNFEPISLRYIEYFSTEPIVITDVSQLDSEHYIEGYYKALFTKDTDKLYSDFGFKKGMIDDLDTVEFKDIKISKNYDYTYLVEFEVTKSQMETLSVGKHKWKTYEGPYSNYIEDLSADAIQIERNNRYAALDLFLSYNSDDTIFSSKYIANDNTHLYIMLALEKNLEKNQFTKEEIQQYAKTYLGLENYQPSNLYFEDELQAYKIPGMGGWNVVYNVIDYKDLGEGSFSYTVNFYGDHYGLSIIDKATYYFTELDDGFKYDGCELLTPRSEFKTLRWSV